MDEFRAAVAQAADEGEVVAWLAARIDPSNAPAMNAKLESFVVDRMSPADQELVRQRHPVLAVHPELAKMLDISTPTIATRFRRCDQRNGPRLRPRAPGGRRRCVTRGSRTRKRRTRCGRDGDRPNANALRRCSRTARLERETPMTNDTVLCLYSCTKAITSVAVMQLVEHGLRLRLDDPARTYVPEIAESRVLEGSTPMANRCCAIRSATSPSNSCCCTRRDSGTHVQSRSRALRQGARRSQRRERDGGSARDAAVVRSRDALEYGISIDWAGRIVEAVRGKRFGDVLREHVFAPLDMRETGFRLTPELRARRATIHLRAADGTLRAKPLIELPQDPQLEMGGHGLYGTAADFVKFIRMILNDGAAPMATASCSRTRSSGWRATDSERSRFGRCPARCRASPTPSTSSGPFQVVGIRVDDQRRHRAHRPARGRTGLGRNRQSLLLDRSRRDGLGGFWATQIFPFIDPVSFPAYPTSNRRCTAVCAPLNADRCRRGTSPHKRHRRRGAAAARRRRPPRLSRGERVVHARRSPDVVWQVADEAGARTAGANEGGGVSVAARATA